MLRPLPLIACLLLGSCDSKDDTGTGEDRDGDGYSTPADCDDSDPDVHPGATDACNGVDDDCDGDTDEDPDLSWYEDADGDGFGNPDALLSPACDQPTGAAPNGLDCDDTAPHTYPGAPETCDGTDEDCDGSVDEDAVDAPTWCIDTDGDGWGDPGTAVGPTCEDVKGHVPRCGDCDESDPAVHPGMDEICDGVDQDCDGHVDDDALDATTWYPDVDLDGWGSTSGAVDECTTPTGYTTTTGDCDDGDPAINPGEYEVCDGVDQDCDGTADDAAVDGFYAYEDADGDGYGAPASAVWACEGLDNGFDCDDADPDEPQTVDGSASASGADGSAAHPWTLVQEGIDAAVGCVVVRPGTYRESIDFNGRGVAVHGLEGPDETFLQGAVADRPVVTIASGEGADTALTGFTISGGGGYYEYFEDSFPCASACYTCYQYTWTWCGGGVFVDGATPTLADLVIADNVLPEASFRSETSGSTYYYYEYSYGGGMCLRNTTLSLDEVDLRGNFADQGGGAWIDENSSVTWSRSLVQDNTATDGAGIELDGGTLALSNVLFAWNTATDSGGGVLAVEGTLRESFVTHGEDDATWGGGIYLSGATTGILSGTIVYGADTGAGVYANGSARFTATYDDVYGNRGGNYSGVTDPTGTSGNISSNPLFTSVTADGNPDNDDWTLQSTSPCRDAADPTLLDWDLSRADMGAYGGSSGRW